MEKKRLLSLCRRGEKAETLFNDGEVRAALAEFDEMARDLETKGDVDSFFAAKLTLGKLRCHVKLGELKAAYQIWNSNLEDSLHGIGIYSLENAQTTLRDMIAYDMICAFLHTVSDSPKMTAAAAVNQYLSRVCEQAAHEGNRALARAAIGNWKLHLRALFGASIPQRIAEPLIQHERALGEIVKAQRLDFPAGSGWERPSDFLEISRVALARTHRASGKKRQAS